ncbi:MAG: AmmeMemoRadiSam system protein B [Bacteroidales bacterium]|nr:AmmeMemoRadiSam system protein B [Bacteroidales bacterium]
MKTRKPAVAGKFYPGTKKEIINLLDTIYQKEKSFINTGLSEFNIIGGIVPHAGYMFSAYQAIHFFEIIKNSSSKFETIFIINPNHTGYGNKLALDENDFWETPFGNVEIDREFMNELNLPVSADAHMYEHSGEVMLPMLQNYLDYEFKIVPISISRQTVENAKLIANSIFNANKKLNKKILIIASSDFSHYVEPKAGKKLDDYVVEEILKFNSENIYKHIINKRISVCGYGPIMTLIEYSKLLEKNIETKILKRGHSGEVMPSNEVVDYISFLFYER